AEDGDRFVVGFDAELLQLGEAFLANLIARLFAVMLRFMQPAERVDDDLLLVIQSQIDAALLAKAVAFHFAPIEALDVEQDIAQALLVVGRILAVIRRPSNDMQLAINGLRVRRLPSGENLVRGGNLLRRSLIGARSNVDAGE